MDIYDEAIKILEEEFGEFGAYRILDAWDFPRVTPGGCLFDMTGWDPAREVGSRTSYTPGSRQCGCLTQAKRNGYLGVPSLLPELMRDDRIPTEGEDIKVENLPAFAEWQRRVDKELGRPAPRWEDERYIRTT